MRRLIEWVLMLQSGLNTIIWNINHIYNLEEIYWMQRGHVRWLQEGDSNTAYFHAMANGRRRKCQIVSLEGDQGIILGEQQILDHIYEFYKALFRE